LPTQKGRDVEVLTESARRRGRPSKFGRPGRAVALTLPEDTIRELRRVHRDLGWAIVKLLEAAKPVSASAPREEQPDVELVDVGERRALIVINLEVFRVLPGVSIIPFNGNRAFLALDAGKGMSDLELAVIDRLGEPAIESRERRALMTLRNQLTNWRRDRHVQLHTRAIIVIERPDQTASPGQESRAGGSARRPAAKRPVARLPGPSRPMKMTADERTESHLPRRLAPARRGMGVTP
jgi:hypothetical protein